MKRSELVWTLGLVSRALASTDLVPIFKCFCFDGKRVTASDGTLAVSAPCKTEDAFAVDGGTLLGLLQNSHEDDVSFNLEDKDVIIKTGRSTFKLPWFPVEDYLFKPPTGKFDLEIEDEELWVGLRACLRTASKDNTQPALMGVSLNPFENQMALYSCDGDSITRCVIPAKGKGTYMLPNSFCEAACKLVVDSGSDEEPAQGLLSLNDEWARVTLNTGFVIHGQLLKSQFGFEDKIDSTLQSAPKYQKIPDELNGALARARVVADPESAKTVLTVEANRMRLVTTTAMGIVRDSCSFPKHPEVEANVCAELMQGAIEMCDEMSVMDNCCTFRKGSTLFIITANMG